MSPRHSSPSIEAILETPEDESRGEIRSKDAAGEMVISSRRHERRYNTAVATAKTSSDRHRERSRRSHRPSSYVSSRSSTTGKSKPSSKRVSISTAREDAPVERRPGHRRTRSHHSSDSSSSSSDEGEVPEDHRMVLAAARERLTSPSLISTLTSMTTATNNSGSSSGSNSTVTQASLSRDLTLDRLEPTMEAPISPAVPDAPDVFSFMEQDSPDEEEEEGEEEEEDGNEPTETEESHTEPQWLVGGIYEASSLPSHASTALQESRSSSGSSSFHSDYTGSEPAADNETDRSSSPERSVKGEDDTAPLDPAQATDQTTCKVASQMLAAQHRQSLHSAFQNVGTPQSPRSTAVQPHVQSKTLSSRKSQHIQHRKIPRAEKIPITGYEALALKLSSHGAKSSGIKPIYRKFERLNHRLLLHLQDELAELEEQLHRLDNVDTQSRSMHGAKPGEIRIFPASRRAAALAGGELEWHKMELINKIACKLSQYNQTLTSFNKLEQNLDTPELSSVKLYRAYLKSEQPVMESETRFLEASGDLVTFTRKPETAIEALPKIRPELSAPPGVHTSFHIIAIAVAAAVLLPILTFSVIPGFLGRMTVVVLVASGAVGTLLQSGITRGAMDKEQIVKEWGSCAAIYGAVMIIVAGVVS